MSPRFAEKYTAAQRDALTDYAIRRRVTARRAIQEAESGRLLPNRDGTPGRPFTMPLKTAQHYINLRRRHIELRALPNVARLPLRDGVGSLSSRLLAIADKKVRALERQGAKAPTTEAISVAKLLGEISKLEPGKGTPAPQDHRGNGRPAGATPAAPRGFLDTLALEDAGDAPDTEIPGENQRGGEEHTNARPAAPAPVHPSTADVPSTHDNGVPSRVAGAGVGASRGVAAGRRGVVDLYPQG
jgi:hypothetical protein